MLSLAAPVSCFLELTPECNNLCPGCSNEWRGSREKSTDNAGAGQLLAGEWLSVVAKLKPYVRRLRLTGGEPTLHPEFEAIVRGIESMGIPFVVFTNGRWENLDWLGVLEELPHFEGFVVSLHGASAHAHELFTGVPGSFDETILNIRRIADAEIPVTTNTVITRHNYAVVWSMAMLSLELGAECATFSRYIGKSLPHISADPWQLRVAIQEVDQLREKGYCAKLSVCIPQCFVKNSSSGCLAGVAFWSVDPWGNVRPCNHVPLRCGNLRQQSVEDIVHSEGLSRWHGLMPDQCYHCTSFSICHGGCRASAILQGKDRDPLISAPLSESPRREFEKQLVFGAGAHPISLYEVRIEQFGYLLIRRNNVLPVSWRAGPLLEAIKNQVTLVEIRDQFGTEGLSFIASLYEEGLVGIR